MRGLILLTRAVVVLAALVGIVLAAGFVAFAMSIAGARVPAGARAEGIVVLTGGGGRIDGALHLLAEGRARRLLISGVNPSVDIGALAGTVDKELEVALACCVDLGRDARDTIGNAAETRDWARTKGYTSLIVVTSDYHMPRSMAELAEAMPKGADPLSGHQSRAAPCRLVAQRLRLRTAVARIRQVSAGHRPREDCRRGARPGKWLGLAIGRPMLRLRSLAFNVTFYAWTVGLTLATLPYYFFVSQEQSMDVVRLWTRGMLWLLKVITGIRYEVRGLENLAQGGALIACKHQSAWETLALAPILPNPTFVMKEELTRIPVFGAYTTKAGMIHIDRKGRTAALRALAERAAQEIAKGRQVVMFPEGTRRRPGAPPDYQTGIALLYKTLGVPVIPAALNSGLYWPRHQLAHHPGTIILEFLPAIPAGLDSRSFLARLESTVEDATDRLMAEAVHADPTLPLAAETAARLGKLSG
jgi:1-acyl-sn-glycerol-3-phosphate acyltransferase